MNKHKKLKSKRPSNFSTAYECIRQIKKSVYLIARGRILNVEKPNEIKWFTIGTGCVVAPNRFITAAHVINDPNSNNPLSKHKAGDNYYLIKHDDEGNWHYRIFSPEAEKSLFTFPEVDLAIIYLEDEFYQDNNIIFASKDDFIRINQNYKEIGTDIAVLGYPLCALTFIDHDISKPKLGNIFLRADTGIINCRYRTAEKIYLYEFTVAFNPGNSGGPIFDWKTGQLLSLVHGYKSIPINIQEMKLNEEDKKRLNIKEYSEKSFIDTVHANYSIGYATPSFNEIFKNHKIIL